MRGAISGCWHPVQGRRRGAASICGCSRRLGTACWRSAASASLSRTRVTICISHVCILGTFGGTAFAIATYTGRRARPSWAMQLHVGRGVWGSPADRVSKARVSHNGGTPAGGAPPRGQLRAVPAQLLRERHPGAQSGGCAPRWWSCSVANTEPVTPSNIQCHSDRVTTKACCMLTKHGSKVRGHT